MSVVGRGGEEETVFEAAGDVTHDAGNARIDGVFGSGGGRGGMGLLHGLTE
jgi:hypothetical protein